MEVRVRSVIRVLTLSLGAAVAAASLKISYGHQSQSLSFIADGYHSLFDATATLLGIFSVVWSNKPPDEGHPYGHQKFETVSAMVLSLFLLFAAYEVGGLAWERVSSPEIIPQFTPWAIAILLGLLVLNVAVATVEARVAKELGSHYLISDSKHNLGDVFITAAILVTVACSHFKLKYVDVVTSVGITFYLIYISMQLIRQNLRPLVDHSVIDPQRVEEIAYSVNGVMHCHAVRSRGQQGNFFLDLNIHLPGHISLFRAHEITHAVEHKLKQNFPGLKDVVIHTEPHNHPPCSKDD
jgi:cation diffusion facilitator family transporter